MWEKQQQWKLHKVEEGWLGSEKSVRAGDAEGKERVDGYDQCML
jgi:hypothetical protein